MHIAVRLITVRYFEAQKAGGRWIGALRPDAVLVSSADLSRASLSIAYAADLDYGNKIATICSLSTTPGSNLADYSPVNWQPPLRMIPTDSGASFLRDCQIFSRV